MYRIPSWIFLLPALCTPGAEAHEYWIEPDRHFVAPGDPVTGTMRVGQDFAGPVFPFLGNRFRSYTIHDAAGARPVKALEGDDVSLRLRPVPGLTLVTYESVRDTATFDSLEDFADYLGYEGLGDIVEVHRAAGLPLHDFSEDYVRCAKALIQAGPVGPADRDRATGLPAELVAMDNPFAPGRTRIDVRMLWRGQPVAGLQVAVFHKGETVTRTLYRTDDDGIARIGIAAPGRYLLNAVRIGRTGQDSGSVWQSHWASLTFAVP